MEIVKGSALEPKTEGPKIIMHIVNDEGGWGRGFVGALSKKWPETEFVYREFAKTTEFGLGKMIAVPVDGDTWVCHMVAQHSYHKKGDPLGKIYVMYEHLSECLEKVFNFAQHIGATVHAPKIGTGLGGGEWEVIKPIIESRLGEIPVTIYEI